MYKLLYIFSIILLKKICSCEYYTDESIGVLQDFKGRTFCLKCEGLLKTEIRPRYLK